MVSNIHLKPEPKPCFNFCVMCVRAYTSRSACVYPCSYVLNNPNIQLSKRRPNQSLAWTHSIMHYSYCHIHKATYQGATLHDLIKMIAYVGQCIILQLSIYLFLFYAEMDNYFDKVFLKQLEILHCQQPLHEHL